MVQINESGFASCPKCGGDVEMVRWVDCKHTYKIDPSSGQEDKHASDIETVAENDWRVQCIGTYARLGPDEGKENCGWQKWRDGTEEMV